MGDCTPPEVIIDRCVDGERCSKFNSINKVILSKQGHIIVFTDPDYGYHQGFWPETKRKSNVYVWHNKKNNQHDDDEEENTLFVVKQVTSSTCGLELLTSCGDMMPKCQQLVLKSVQWDDDLEQHGMTITDAGGCIIQAQKNVSHREERRKLSIETKIYYVNAATSARNNALLYYYS